MSEFLNLYMMFLLLSSLTCFLKVVCTSLLKFALRSTQQSARKTAVRLHAYLEKRPPILCFYE